MGKHPRTEQGQGLVEYAALLAMMTLVLVAVLTLMHDRIGSTFSTLISQLP